MLSLIENIGNWCEDAHFHWELHMDGIFVWCKSPIVFENCFVEDASTMLRRKSGFKSLQFYCCTSLVIDNVELKNLERVWIWWQCVNGETLTKQSQHLIYGNGWQSETAKRRCVSVWGCVELFYVLNLTAFLVLFENVSDVSMALGRAHTQLCLTHKPPNPGETIHLFLYCMRNAYHNTFFNESLGISTHESDCLLFCGLDCLSHTCSWNWALATSIMSDQSVFSSHHLFLTSLQSSHNTFSANSNTYYAHRIHINSCSTSECFPQVRSSEAIFKHCTTQENNFHSSGRILLSNKCQRYQWWGIWQWDNLYLAEISWEKSRQHPKVFPGSPPP